MECQLGNLSVYYETFGQGKPFVTISGIPSDQRIAYPRATFAVLDRAGHALGVEQQVLFQALIHEWLDRVEELS